MWFKSAQKRAGKTSFDLGHAIDRDRSVISRIVNGTQMPTLDQARILAQELGVTLDSFLEKAGMASAPTAQAFSPGFAEADAAPYTPQPENEGRERAIAMAMGQRAGVDVWRVKSNAMAMAGLIDGDFILVDTHAAERAKAGDVVVAQIYNPRGATTVLRWMQPPVLVSASPNPADISIHVVDGINVVVRGKVVASWRLKC